MFLLFLLILELSLSGGVRARVHNSGTKAFICSSEKLS